MKKIFDGLREQIGDIDVNDIDVLQDMALEKVDEAEAKWEADCCEWEHKRYHANCLCKCNDNHFFLDYDLVSSFRVCPYCGKPIKIVEVE